MKMYENKFESFQAKSCGSIVIALNVFFYKLKKLTKLIEILHIY